MSFFPLGQLLRRSRRLKAYRQARSEAEAMSDADLADIGLKRWQLGRVARAKALK
jgi:uncharacterized protein YjiS (DUF1127 family)